MRHGCGKPVAKVYCDSKFASMETQGPIVAFNLLNRDGTYIGFAKVLVSILYLVLNTSFTSNAAGKTYHFANSTIWKIWTQMSF